MKRLLILSILTLCFIATAVAQTKVQEINITKGLDKDKVWMVLSDTTHRKYSYGKLKCFDWDSVKNTLGGSGDLPYYELVANYSTDGTNSNHTFTVLDNTFPGTTWSSINLTVDGRIDLIANTTAFDFLTNNNKIILIQSGFKNVLDNRFETKTAYGVDDDTIRVEVYNYNDNGVQYTDLDSGILVHPLPIIIRYYY